MPSWWRISIRLCANYKPKPGAHLDDRPPAHPDRPLVADRARARAAAELPVPAELLDLCNHRAFPLWRASRELAGAPADRALSSLGGFRLRPRTRESIN